MLKFAIFPSLISLVSAHFTLDYPEARGFDEDQVNSFPCGGQNTVSASRTAWPLAGGPIQLTMEHDRAAVQVLLALGNDATDAFNTILVPTTQEEGIGRFCLSDVKLPEGLTVQEGDNATIQVVTNGDPSGGLYNCADITFSSTNSTASECTNGRGVTMTKYTGKSANANGTDSAMSTGAATATATGSASTGSPASGASMREVGGTALLGALVLQIWTLCL
ncbi:MAG: hypothetical protein Q9222_001081 [Ikaeria aurantiellina]